MNIEKEIRKLARSNHWQTIYNANKDCANINLFENKNNISDPQAQFLQWLSIYNMLYIELAQRESVFLTENVIKNDYRCNAYLYYRKKKIENEWLKHQKDKKVNNRTTKFKSEGKKQIIDVDLRSV